MRFTIKLKLFLTFAFMLAVLIGTAAYGILSLGGLNTTLGDVLNGPAERLKLAQTLNNLQLQQIPHRNQPLHRAQRRSPQGVRHDLPGSSEQGDGTGQGSVEQARRFHHGLPPR